MSETIWMRTREAWIHAVALDNGTRFHDVPTSVLERLLENITGAWAKRGTDTALVVDVDGGGGTARYGDTANPDARVVSGDLATRTRRAAGRGTIANAPEAPAWI